MGKDIPDIQVLWVEADNEAQFEAHSKHAVRSLAAYLLLTDTVVLHPAYIWQSKDTHELIFGKVGKALDVKSTKLFLSADAESVAEYMNRRVEKAKTVGRAPGSLSSEQAEYSRYSLKDRESQQGWLDEKYGNVDGVLKSSWSRDAEFRRLVSIDLKDSGRLGDTVSAILQRDQVPQRETLDNAKRLSEKVMDLTFLASADSIVMEVAKLGSYESKTLQTVASRLHVLHWACHVGDGVRVPHVQRLTDKDSLDPFDPELFWDVMQGLFGHRIQAVLSLPDDALIEFAMQLRGDGTWLSFRHTYRQIVEEIDRLDLPLEGSSLVSALNVALPSRARVVGRRLLRAPGIKLIVSAIRGMYGDVAQILPATTSAVAILKDMANAASVYNESLRGDIPGAIRAAIRKARPDLLERDQVRDALKQI